MIKPGGHDPSPSGDSMNQPARGRDQAQPDTQVSLPSLRHRLIVTLSGAGMLLLIIISLLMVVAEDKMKS